LRGGAEETQTFESHLGYPPGVPPVGGLLTAAGWRSDDRQLAGGRATVDAALAAIDA
jgi:hypothetical protein